MLNSASGITSVRDNLTVDNTLTVDDNTTLNGITTITPTSGSTFVVLSETDSSSKTTGAVVVSGGVGIGKDLHVGGDITAFATSDINLKENINVIPNALDKVKALTGNTFTWKSGAGHGDDTGVIAQEVISLGLPGITTTRDNGTKAVQYDKLIPILIQAIKELSAKVDALS